MKDINYTIEQTAKELKIPEHLVNDVIRHSYQFIRAGLQDKTVSYINFGGFGLIRFHAGMSIRYMSKYSEIIESTQERIKNGKNKPVYNNILKESIEQHKNNIIKVYELSKDFKKKTGYTKEYQKTNNRVNTDIQSILESNEIPKFFPANFKTDNLPEKDM